MPSFTIPFKHLQEHSQDDAVRKLNEEFKSKGGRVSFKSTKKGQAVKLSHDEQEYLENFEKRLLKQLGLVEEEGKEGQAEGEKKEGEEKGDGEGGSTPDSKSGDPPTTSPDKEGPTIDDKVMDLIREALQEGAIDDGQIIKHGYSTNAEEDVIQALRKKLRSGRCGKPDIKCRVRRKQMNFEEVMKGCCGLKENCKEQRTKFCMFFDKWKSNVDEMFSEFTDKEVRVKGKISYYKHIDKDKGAKHYKLLIYDTFVTNKEDIGTDKAKETRKLWCRIEEEDFNKLNAEGKYNLEDIVEIDGKIIWSDFFYDYWIEDVQAMKVVEKGKGNPIKSE